MAPPPPRNRRGSPRHASSRWRCCAVPTTWRAAAASWRRLDRNVTLDETQGELLQTPDQGPAAGADPPAIDLGDRSDAGVGAGDEGFLRGVGFGQTEVLL